jgi:hypothetical protein
MHEHSAIDLREKRSNHPMAHSSSTVQTRDDFEVFARTICCSGHFTLLWSDGVKPAESDFLLQLHQSLNLG